jgi:hypothetical protein
LRTPRQINVLAEALAALMISRAVGLKERH